MDSWLVVVLALLLALVWVASTRAHLRRRAGSAADWNDAADRPELWTSAARCPDCGSGGGLLTVGEQAAVEFECLACGARHRREHRA